MLFLAESVDFIERSGRVFTIIMNKINYNSMIINDAELL